MDRSVGQGVLLLMSLVKIIVQVSSFGTHCPILNQCIRVSCALVCIIMFIVLVCIIVIGTKVICWSPCFGFDHHVCYFSLHCYVWVQYVLLCLLFNSHHWPPHSNVFPIYIIDSHVQVLLQFRSLTSFFYCSDLLQNNLFTIAKDLIIGNIFLQIKNIICNLK
jgi:hypothetical protein